MKNGNSVLVIKLPGEMKAKPAELFFVELQPRLSAKRPQLVFDFSGVVSLDATGIEVLLQCLARAMQLNGDIKLAALSDEQAALLEALRALRLFEVFPNTAAAVESFYPALAGINDSEFVALPETLQDVRGNAPSLAESVV